MGRGRPKEYPKVLECDGCGEIYVAQSGKDIPLCWQCRIKKMNVVVRDMRRRYGEYYERWKAGMERWIKSQKGGGSW